MDYTHVGDKYWIVLTHSDCLRLSAFGFECFDIFLTCDDWNQIAELPALGFCYFHFDPTASQFMRYAIESSEPFDKVYETLNSLRFAHEQRMIDNDWPFPEETI